MWTKVNCTFREKAAFLSTAFIQHCTGGAGGASASEQESYDIFRDFASVSLNLRHLWPFVVILRAVGTVNKSWYSLDLHGDLMELAICGSGLGRIWWIFEASREGL